MRDLTATIASGDYWSAAGIASGLRNEARSHASYVAEVPAAPQGAPSKELVAQLVAGLQNSLEQGDWEAVASRTATLQKVLIAMDDELPVQERIARFSATLKAAGGHVVPEALWHLSDLSLKAAQYADAEKYAEASLTAAQRFPDRQMQLMRAWTLVGVARLRQGNRAGAIDALHQSVADLDPIVETGIGPSMRLAKELLSAGARSEVKWYVAECASHQWNRGGEDLPKWQAEIESGKVPNFKGNCLF